MASIKDLNRMCIMQTGCINCPLHSKDVSCLPDSLPDNADEIVDKWVAEHPVKTYAMDFFEKFPDAPRKVGGIPVPCLGTIYSECYNNECSVGGCSECWNRKMKENG